MKQTASMYDAPESGPLPEQDEAPQPFGDLIEHRPEPEFKLPPPRFFHYRLLDETFNPENGQKSRFLPKGGVTVCVLPTLAVNALGYALTLGIKVCSPSENYNKHRGRDKSIGRARQLAKHNRLDQNDESEYDVIDGEDLFNLVANLADRAWREMLYKKSARGYKVEEYLWSARLWLSSKKGWAE